MARIGLALLVLAGLAWSVHEWRTMPTVATVPDVPTGSETSRGSAPERSIFALELDARYSSLPAFDGVEFADELQREQAAYNDVLRRTNGQDRNFDGALLNIVDGVRHTFTAPPCECRRIRLWFSGGSAAWGVGQRDEHTIASELVRLAAADGIALDVANLGQQGHTFSQEVSRLTGQLQSGPAPDIVVFFNGWNDASSRMASDFVRGPDPSREVTEVSMDDLIAVNDRVDEFLVSPIGPDAGRAAAANYRRLRAQVDELQDEYRFDSFYFFQPDAFTNEAQMSGYEEITGIPNSALRSSPMAEAVASMAEELDGEVVNLRDLFDDSPEPVFVGLVHQNEVGARVVAEAIYGEIAPELDRLADS